MRDPDWTSSREIILRLCPGGQKQRCSCGSTEGSCGRSVRQPVPNKRNFVHHVHIVANRANAVKCKKLDAHTYQRPLCGDQESSRFPRHKRDSYQTRFCEQFDRRHQTNKAVARGGHTPVSDHCSPIHPPTRSPLTQSLSHFAYSPVGVNVKLVEVFQRVQE